MKKIFLTWSETESGRIFRHIQLTFNLNVVSHIGQGTGRLEFGFLLTTVPLACAVYDLLLIVSVPLMSTGNMSACLHYRVIWSLIIGVKNHLLS